MYEEQAELQRQRIHRLIRDLNIRYIKGAIDRRTYQTLKQKYQKMLESLPQQYEKTKELIDEPEKVRDEIKQIQEEITPEARKPVIQKIKLPSI
ncbi:MAG: hypothetical protein ACTSPI_08140, partial [Candidatus Heimdallarchaeaceae archaeon]